MFMATEQIKVKCRCFCSPLTPEEIKLLTLPEFGADWEKLVGCSQPLLCKTAAF